MYDALLGFTTTMVAIAIAFFVVVAISRVLFGSIGTAILALIIALTAAWSGWRWLMNADSLGLQLIGWALPGLLIWTLAKTVQVQVRKHRATAEQQA